MWGLVPGTESEPWSKLQTSDDGKTVVATSLLDKVWVSRNGGPFVFDGNYGAVPGLTADGQTLYVMNADTYELRYVSMLIAPPPRPLLLSPIFPFLPGHYFFNVFNHPIVHPSSPLAPDARPHACAHAHAARGV